MKKITTGFLFLFLIPLFFGFTPGNDRPLKIALSKSSPNYINWIRKGDSTILVVDLGGMKPEEALLKLRDCDGLLLTGGGDIDPANYMGTENKELCTDIDRERDALEKAAIVNAQTLKMPILGICRGEQMLNVFMGGNLISDIPSWKKKKYLEKMNGTVDGSLTGMTMAVPADMGQGKKDPSDLLHQCDDYTKCYHTVWLKPASLLHSIIGYDTGFVTTNHHQAVLKTGKDIRINAQAADSIAEGIEWIDVAGKSFMLGVQWHPERMETANAFSGKILNRFIAEVKKYSQTPHTIK